LRHLQCWRKKGVKSVKHHAQLKLLPKPQQNINTISTANLKKKKSLFFKTTIFSFTHLDPNTASEHEDFIIP